MLTPRRLEDALYLIEATPALAVHGKLTLPLTEILTALPKGQGWIGYFTRPQVAHGLLWVRAMDQLRVYDIRSPKQGRGEGDLVR
jgi:hypothetical protein